MKSFTVTKNDAGKRLDSFITKNAPLLPKNLLYKYIRLKRIKLNGKKSEISARLKENDVVDMYINDEFFEKKEYAYSFMKAPKQLNIVYEDENIILLDKKAGVLCHPDNGEYVDTLITRVQRYLCEKGEYDPEKENSFAPALANRIDRNTGGIVIAAKNAQSLKILNEKIKNRELKKMYMCVAVGYLKKKSGILESYMLKNEQKNRVFVYDRPVEGAKTAKTGYKVLAEANGLSLLEIELFTGRTHQIRAHMASIGHPLLGDGKYGTNAVNKKYGGYKKQFLYSYRLDFDFKTDSGILSYLNGKSFTVGDVWFKTAFLNGEL